MACRQRTLTPPDTWSCPTLGLACVLMSRPISPELALSPDLWISNTPRFFSFALLIFWWGFVFRYGLQIHRYMPFFQNVRHIYNNNNKTYHRMWNNSHLLAIANETRHSLEWGRGLGTSCNFEFLPKMSPVMLNFCFSLALCRYDSQMKMRCLYFSHTRAHEDRLI